LNGFSQIDIKMDKKKLLLFVGIFLFLILGLSVLSTEEVNKNGINIIKDFGNLFMNLPEGSIIGSEDGVKYDKLKEGGRFTFTGEESSLIIQGSSFEGVLPKDSDGHSSFIEVNLLGNITKADFAVGENGGEYLIGGVKFDLPPNSRVYYDNENGFRFPEGTKITSLSEFYNLGRELQFEGNNLNFIDEVIVNGQLKLNKYGYLIGKGEATYEGMKIDNFFGHSDVAILKNNLDKLKEEDISELSWIKKDSNGLEFSSSSTGSIFVEFLEGNDILNVGKHGKLELRIDGGDKLKISKFSGVPRFNYIPSENGFTNIINDGLSLELDKGGKHYVDISPVTLKDFSLDKYAAVPAIIESDVLDEEIRINSRGTLYGVLVDNTGGKKVEEIVYDLENPIMSLKTEELNGLMGSLKENIKEEGNLDSAFRASQFFLLSAKNNHFTTSENIDLAKKIVQSSGEYSDSVLYKVKFGLDKLSKDDVKISYGKFSQFTLKNLDNLDFKYGDGLDKLDAVYSVLNNGLKENKDFNLIEDFSLKIIKSDFNSDKSILLLSKNINEYNGANFESMKLGAEVVGRYNMVPGVVDFLDLKYSNIKDKKTFGKEYALALNQYFKDKDSIQKSDSQMASFTLDQMHLLESQIEHSDIIRNSIISNLDANSKYYLIANSEGNNNLFTSTFEKIYSSIDKKDVSELMKSVDPNGDYWLKFTTELSARGKLPELYKQDTVFYRKLIQDSFDNHDEDILFENAVLMTETFQDLYNRPDIYPGEKEAFEEFLISKYKSSESNNEKGVYAYLLKLNTNPNTQKAEKIINDLPELRDAILPSSFSQRDEIAAKLYFYSDENWFSIATNDFNSNYKMDLEWNNGRQARLSKPINGKKIIIDLELNDPSVDFVPSIEEDIKGQTYLYIAHRGHSFNTEKTYPDFLSSDTTKIIHLAGCGSHGALADYQKKFPNSFFIADKDAGEGFPSDKVAYFVLEGIAEGKLNWEDLTPDFAEEKGLVFPEQESLPQYLKRYESEM